MPYFATYYPKLLYICAAMRLSQKFSIYIPKKAFINR
jgi:hypothetical protein